eukprot:IDg16729t1
MPSCLFRQRRPSGMQAAVAQESSLLVRSIMCGGGAGGCEIRCGDSAHSPAAVPDQDRFFMRGSRNASTFPAPPATFRKHCWGRVILYRRLVLTSCTVPPHNFNAMLCTVHPSEFTQRESRELQEHSSRHLPRAEMLRKKLLDL